MKRKAHPIPELSCYAWGRFHGHIAKGAPDDCWEWTGAKAAGYGRFKSLGKVYGAHRIAYTIAHGPIPAGSGYHGTVVMHTCDNRACCNPAHMRLGTAFDNAQDMAAKGRSFPQIKNRNRPDLSTRPGRKWLQAEPKVDVEGGNLNGNNEKSGSPTWTRTKDNSINSRILVLGQSNL